MNICVCMCCDVGIYNLYSTRNYDFCCKVYCRRVLVSVFVVLVCVVVLVLDVVYEV